MTTLPTLGVQSTVWQSVCPLSYLKNHTSKLHKILHTLNVAAARPSSDDSATVLVLWMTSCLPIIPEAKVTPIGHIL